MRPSLRRRAKFCCARARSAGATERAVQLLALPQRGLGAFFLGHVVHRADHLERLVRARLHEDPARLAHVPHLAAASHDAVLDDVPLPLLQSERHRRAHRGDILGMHQAEKQLPRDLHLRRGEAEDPVALRRPAQGAERGIDKGLQHELPAAEIPHLLRRRHARRALAELGLGLAALAPQARLPQRLVDRLREAAEAVLQKIVGRAELHRRHRRLLPNRAGHHDEGHIGLVLLHERQRVNAGEAG